MNWSKMGRNRKVLLSTKVTLKISYYFHIPLTGSSVSSTISNDLSAIINICPQIINIIDPHSEPMWSVLLLSYFKDEEIEAQRGGVIRPKPHSRLAGISMPSFLLHGRWPPIHQWGLGAGMPGPLPMYMELGLEKGLAGRMEFCRASSLLEGGGS